MTDNLVLEHLRAIRADVAQVKTNLADLTAHMRLMADQVVGLVRHENYSMTKFAELESRVDRIERRLDLVG
jgi:molybdopterin-guanine dinucleotide biosynthesis protein